MLHHQALAMARGLVDILALTKILVRLCYNTDCSGSSIYALKVPIIKAGDILKNIFNGLFLFPLRSYRDEVSAERQEKPEIEPLLLVYKASGLSLSAL